MSEACLLACGMRNGNLTSDRLTLSFVTKNAVVRRYISHLSCRAAAHWERPYLEPILVQTSMTDRRENHEDI